MTNEIDEAERNLRQAVSQLANCKPHDNALAWSAAVEAIGTYAAIAEVVRKRLETVEDLWHQEQQAHTAAVTHAEQAEGQQRSDVAKMQEWRERAEQAERERDEARECEEAARKHTRFVETEWAKRFDEVDAARERAEADNAALTRAIHDALSRFPWPSILRDETPQAVKDGADRVVAVLNEALSIRSTPALLERMRSLEAVVEKFREVQWARGDWQGFCAFRRALRCDATDGNQSAMGTPNPRPHITTCPYHALAALKPETK